MHSNKNRHKDAKYSVCCMNTLLTYKMTQHMFSLRHFQAVPDGETVSVKFQELVLASRYGHCKVSSRDHNL